VLLIFGEVKNMAVTNIIKLSKFEGSKRIDAEFYQPKYFFLLNKLKNSGVVPLKKVAKPIRRKFQPKEDEFFDYIEIAEVDLSTGAFNISKILGKDAPDRAQWIVKKGDILVSTVRPIRNAIVLINKNQETLVCSSGFCVLHPKNIPSEYLFLYLKNDFIAYLLDRYTTTTEYPAVSWNDILNIPVYLGDDESFRKNISNFIQKVFRLLKTSESLYSQAESLLLEKLKLNVFKPKYKLFYTANLSKAFGHHRIDAEYFQPCYDDLIKYLGNKFETVPLKKFILNFQKGIEVGSKSYQKEGKPFIRVSNLSIHGLVEKDQKYIDDKLYQNLRDIYEPKIGDFLLTKDATPGIAYVTKEPTKGIIASGILKLNIDENEIYKEYLALCVNLMIGKMQIERDGGGSVITHWRPEQIKNLHSVYKIGCCSLTKYV